MTPLRWKSLPGVESAPGRRGGEPVLVGTRIPAKAIGKQFLAGDSLRTVVEWWTCITVPQVEAAIRYAAHPRRAAFERAALKRSRAYARGGR